MRELVELLNKGVIVAPATPPGRSALAIVRLSGAGCIELVNQLFKGKDLSLAKGKTLHYGLLEFNGELIDEVVIAIYRGSNSFTGEDSVEISSHGSGIVVEKIVSACLALGAKTALPGEFSRRAFANGKLDLTQTEAIADLIHAESAAAHKAALNQLRGNFSKRLMKMREELTNFASLVELELDFSEEDVEFANRENLLTLLTDIQRDVSDLAASFKAGNAIKNGISVAIVGRPNAGKSTLLNQLLNEERAIVSNIPGTTRDVIEDTLHISGLLFRMMDTAGIRDTEDEIEAIGVKRSLEKIKQADIVLYLVDASTATAAELKEVQDSYEGNGSLFFVLNKVDLTTEGIDLQVDSQLLIPISAKTGTGIEALKQRLVEAVNLGNSDHTEATIITNLRHYQELLGIAEQLSIAIEGLNTSAPTDIIAMSLRQSLIGIGNLTGSAITPDDLLANIFSKFCIGK